MTTATRRGLDEVDDGMEGDIRAESLGWQCVMVELFYLQKTRRLLLTSRRVSIKKFSLTSYFLSSVSGLISKSLNWISMVKPAWICKPIRPSFTALGLSSNRSVVVSPLVL